MGSRAARCDRAVLGIAVLGIALLMGMGMATPVAAEIYRWSDERGHVHYADGLDSVPQPYRAQATAIGLRNSSASTSAPEPSVRPESAGVTTIRYTPGSRILVDARVNGQHGVRLLLDTGADRTLISPRALVAAGVSLTRGGIRGSIAGVTGTADVQGVRIESLEVGEARVGPLLIISYDMSRTSYDGLLGRDFLDRFEVVIDSSLGTVTLSPRK